MRFQGRRWFLAAAGLLALGGPLAYLGYSRKERRTAVVVPGRIFRGAWQAPEALRRIIARERVRTIVTLTAINRDDPKYLGQKRVIDETGADWIIVPMRGSTATLDQLVETADLLANATRQPVFFHCVGGHHRSNLAQAAYRIRHQGWSADQAWAELAALPWSRPKADADRRDRRVLVDFALAYRGSGTRLALGEQP